MDRYAKHLAIASALRGQLCELELVSRLTLPDGSLTEITNVRRAVCKRVTRRRNATVLTLADIDRSALEREFPFETFTVDDFPELFIDHVDWRVPDGMGIATKVPLAWIKKTGGTWRYAGPNMRSSPAVLAVYRGTQPGQGALVDPSEYSVSSAVGSVTGVSVLTVDFAREQIDFQGRPYILEADVAFGGQYLFGLGGESYTAAHEIARLLSLCNVSYDLATFGPAATVDSSLGFFPAALYGTRDRSRTVIAIVEDLLAIARGYLSPTNAGAWAIVQDVAKASTWQFDTSIAADRFTVQEYGDGEIPKSVSLDYRPRVSGLEEYTGHLTRATNGAAGELKLANPYITQHLFADQYLSYWQKRLNSLRVATAVVHGGQLANGEAIDVTDQVTWSGTKKFIATGVSRAADSNRLRLREYDASIYVYTPGTLPADATNGYTPDYSFTTPLAPTGLAVISQGTTIDTDGKLKAHALIRATPPTVNWKRIIAQVKDLTTNEIYQAQLLLNAGNYEATIGGLSPGRNHEVRAWAVNANNLDGAITAAVAFTSANSANAPTAVTVGAQQLSPRQIFLTWTAASPGAGSTPVDGYVIDRKVGGGSFAVLPGTFQATSYVDDNVSLGTTYQYKIRAVDRNGNVASDSNTASLTPQALISDSLVTTQGISGVSIANSSINRVRTNTSTGSATGIILAGTSIFAGTDKYAFAPAVGQTGGTANTVYRIAIQGTPTDDAAAESLLNVGGVTASYDIRWRSFPP